MALRIQVIGRSAQRQEVGSKGRETFPVRRQPLSVGRPPLTVYVRRLPSQNDFRPRTLAVRRRPLSVGRQPLTVFVSRWQSQHEFRTANGRRERRTDNGERSTANGERLTPSDLGRFPFAVNR